MRTSKIGLGVALSAVLSFCVAHAEEVPVGGDLRKREHMLSWENSSSSTKVTPSGSSSLKTSSGDMNISYGRNWGWWGAGVGLSSNVTKDTDNDEATASVLYLEGRGNFIENRPGNNLIPYAAIQLGRITGEAEDGADTTDISGNAWAIGVGLDWFPFGELFALNVNLGVTNGDMDYKATGGTVKADSEGTSLSVGYRLVF